MKQLFTYTLTIILGLISSILISANFIGFNETFASLNIFARRTTTLVDPPIKSLTRADLASSQSVLAASEYQYDTLNINPQIKKIKTELIPAPFIVPTNGIAGHQNFLYLPPVHPGIDIWTRSDGSGLTDNKGFPVYAACSGQVTRIFEPNQEIEIICDEISNDYQGLVPSLRVKTLYSHLGDAETKQWHHSLRLGQRVAQGEQIGFQGNISSFAPWNRVVHLHFGIYDLTKSGRPSLDPYLYIGVPTNKVGQIFEAGI